MANNLQHQIGLRYLLVLDFEATCQDGRRIDNQEIIEFPTLIYDLHSDAVTSTFHEYVRPIHNPILTTFCRNLTGIQQSTVDSADTFPGVWSRFHQFLVDQGLLGQPSSFAFITCGDWDLKTMLPNQLRLSDSGSSNLSHHPSQHFRRWINIKKAFADHYDLRMPGGMPDMLSRLGLSLEGRHHSGIDDCKNITSIVKKMREDGWDPTGDD